MGSLIVSLVAFGVAFSWLIYNAFSLADTNIGLSFSFTGYAYISIEATFIFLILYGGYYVFKDAIRKPTIEVEVYQ